MPRCAAAVAAVYGNTELSLLQSKRLYAGQAANMKQTDGRIWLVSFLDYDLGYFDDETSRLEILQNPFGSKVLAMRPFCPVTHMPGTDLDPFGAPGGIRTHGPRIRNPVLYPAELRARRRDRRARLGRKSGRFGRGVK